MSRIIVVDDDPDVRSAIAMVLEMDGHDCELFGSAREAFDRHRAKPADVLLLDQMMPGMTGAEVCKMLRQNNDFTPVIFLSADREIDRRVQGLPQSKVIKKPFDMDELLESIRALQ